MRSLSEYYGDPTSGRYSTAREIAQALASVMDSTPRIFRRSDVVEKLKLESRRELALVTDALHALRKQGLIDWDEGTNSWRNLSR